MMATAQTGTGKTASYALPILQLLARREIKEKVARAMKEGIKEAIRNHIRPLVRNKPGKILNSISSKPNAM